MSGPLELTLLLSRFREGWTVVCQQREGVPPLLDEFIPPLSRTEIKLLRSQVREAARSCVLPAEVATRASKGAAMNKVLENTGASLFNALLPGKVQTAFRERRDEAKHGFRLRLCINDPELQELPWELLFDPDLRSFLLLRNGVTVVRSGPESLLPLRKVTPPVRVLIVAASPKSERFASLAWRQEEEEIRRCLKPYDDFEVLPTICGPNTRGKLIPRLRGPKEPHVLHFIGHGSFVADNDEGALVFEDSQGRPQLVSASQLVNEIGGMQDLRLIVLNSCFGLLDGNERSMSAVASGLFAQGTPALVAMQNEIIDGSAREFATSFYESLALGAPVDEAVTTARRRLFDLRTPEWCMPVLFLGVVDGNVFGREVTEQSLVDQLRNRLFAAEWEPARQLAERVVLRVLDTRMSAQVHDLKDLIDQLGAWQRATRTCSELLDHPHNDLAQDAMTSWVDATKAVDRSLAVRVLGAEHPWIGELEYHQRIADIHGSMDKDRWERLLPMLSDVEQREARRDSRGMVGDTAVRLLDLGKERLQRYVTEQLRVELGWREAQNAWEVGGWESALLAARSVLDSGAGDRRTRELWSRRTQSLQLLVTATKATGVDKGTVPAELASLRSELLEAVDPADPPPTLNTVCEALEVAIRLLGEIADEAELESLRSRWTIAGARAAVIEPDWIEHIETLVNKAIDLWQTTSARHAFERGRFEQAALAFERLGHREGVVLCRHWQTLVEQVQSRQWEPAQATLLQIEQQQRQQPELAIESLARWIDWCRRAPNICEVIDRMCQAELVAEPRVPGPDGPSPYSVLTAHGGLPTMTLTQASDQLSFAAQEATRGSGNSVELRTACNSMQRAELRLVADFAVYRVVSPDRVRRVRQRLGEVQGCIPGITAGELAQELAEDIAVFRALSGNYASALASLGQQIRDDVSRRTSLHQYGLVVAASIEALPPTRSPDTLRRHCEQLIEGWGAVFGDEQGFWHDWWRQKRSTLQHAITKDQVDEARQRLQLFWSQRLAAVPEAGPTLEMQFLAEIRGARLVAAMGGIPLDAVTPRRAVLGLMGVTAFGASESLARWVATLDADHPSRADLLTWFSQLALPASMRDDGRHAEAVRHLSGFSDEDAADVELNPAFAQLSQPRVQFARQRSVMLVNCLRQAAIAAVSAIPMRSAEAVDWWRQALELARAYDSDCVADVRAEIIDFSVGRAHQVAQRAHSKEYRAALSSCIDLLKTVADCGWDDAAKTVQRAWVERTLDMAVYVSNMEDDEALARELARKAYGIRPDHLRAIEVFAIATLHRSQQQYSAGDERRASALIDEVEKTILPAGLQQYPDSIRLQRVEEMVRHLRTRQAGSVRDKLATLLRELKDEGPAQEESSDERPEVAAAILAAEGRYREAVDAYWSVVRSRPDDRHTAERLAQCYWDWIFKLHREGRADPSLLKSIAEEARTRCPNSRLLDEIRGLG